MPYVLTVDQIDSRHQSDLVSQTIASFDGVPTLAAFTRTVGDEFQAVLDDAVSVVDVILDLMRTTRWHIGVGVGPVETPLPHDPRSGRGAAFLAARAAVDQAKTAPHHVVVQAAAPGSEEGHDAQVVLSLLAALRERRSASGWEAVDLVATGTSVSDAADHLKVSRQAVGQRLQAAQWALEQETVPVLARLLARAERAAAA